MKLVSYFIFFFAGMGSLISQSKNGFNVAMGVGASYFFNDGSTKRRIDNTLFVGMNYMIYNKNQTFCFNPGLNTQVNQYHTKISNTGVIEVDQHLLALNLDVLLKLNKRILLRAGLAFGRVFHSTVDRADTYFNSRSYYSTSEFYKDYSPTNFQSGFTVGISFRMRVIPREHKFNIRFNQLGSRIVNSDFYLNKSLVGQDMKVLSAGARPSTLTLGFDFNLKRVKKKKVEEE